MLVAYRRGPRYTFAGPIFLAASDSCRYRTPSLSKFIQWTKIMRTGAGGVGVVVGSLLFASMRNIYVYTVAPARGSTDWISRLYAGGVKILTDISRI